MIYCVRCKREPMDCMCKERFQKPEGRPDFPIPSTVKFGVVYRNKITGEKLKMTMGSCPANYFELRPIEEGYWEGTAQDLLEQWEIDEPRTTAKP